jgi:HEAT repeat protein
MDVRASVARALVQIGTPDAIKAVKDTVSVLIQALQNQDGIVRADAAYVLGAIGESAKDAVPALIQVWQDEGMDVRINAAEALMQIGTPEALKAVEEYQ